MPKSPLAHGRNLSAQSHPTKGGTALQPQDNQQDNQETPAAVEAPTLVPSVTAGVAVAQAVADWRATLVSLAGGSSLADITLLGDAILDLTSAHPSGIAQLFAGRPTRLPNIFRDPATLPIARHRTRAVSQRSTDQAERYGIAPTYLAIGIATWTETSDPQAQNDVAALARVTNSATPVTPDPAGSGEPRTVQAPVLLRPITISSMGQDTDYELSLEPSAEINPVLARALRSRGALLDPVALARGAFTGNGFDPSTALDRVNTLGQAVLPDFTLTDKVLVGTFVHPGQALVDDLDDLVVGLERHEIIAALAGADSAIAALQVPLPAVQRGDSDPNMERGVGDLDITGRGALDALATGAHLFIDAPIGADSTGVAAAIIAEAAAIGRNVLYVPGHRRAAEDLTARLRGLGLDELLLDVVPSPNWRTIVSRRLLSAMTLEPESLDSAAIAENRTNLVATRTKLGAMVDGLHQPRAPWGISAYDSLQALARLTATGPTPSTTVRFTTETALHIASGNREAIGQDLFQLAQLGGFTLRPASTPWFGVDLDTDEAATQALEDVETQLSGPLAMLRSHIARVSEDTGLVPAKTLDQWGEQLEMLAAMRIILDSFLPLVFERTAEDLVAATATKQWRAQKNIEMSGVVRRRLVKRAKDMLRPGVRVPDLHASLLEVQTQRAVWATQCPGGGWPRLPNNLPEIEDNFAEVVRLCQKLEPVLASTPLGANLTATDIADLEERFKKLRDDAPALVGLPERTRIYKRLVAHGLTELLDDFTTRRVEPMFMDAELDLAWWASVFQNLLAADPNLADVEGSTFDRLAKRFRALDTAHVNSLAAPIRVASVVQLQTALNTYREQSEGLFSLLIEERLTSVRAAVEDYGDVMRKLRPCTVATPTMVPHLLPAHRTVDLVVLDAVQHLPIETLLSAIARGRQVVVIGDPRSAAGGAIAQLARILPRVSLAGDSLRRDQGLTHFLMKHGYSDVLAPMPLPAAEELVRFEQVYGTGMPDPETGTVLSTQVEIDRVVDLAITHALDHGDESLAIVAGSQLHADRIREAILSQVRQNVALAAFFDPRRLEPVIISDLRGVAGLNRDAVIFTLGFGRTPHGRTLHRFGEISEPMGAALLLNALGVTRRRFTLVSCFAIEDLEVERLRSEGARMLGALLDFAAGGSGDPIATVEKAGTPAGMIVSGLMTTAVPVERSAAGDSGLAGEGDPAQSQAQGQDREPSSVEGNEPQGANGADPLEQEEASGKVTDSDQVSEGSEQPDSAVETGPVVGQDSSDVVLPQGSEIEPEPAADGSEPDRLLVDLADRLWRFGLTVETNYGLEGGEKIPLVVGHPDLPEEFLVAVLTDDLAYVQQPSLRARDRHRAERLERLGWHVVNVWAVALFLNPEAQANQIREAVFRVEASRKSRNYVTTGALPIVGAQVQQAFAEVEAAAGQDDLLQTGSQEVLTTPQVAAQEAGVERSPRPDVPYGLPLTAYGDNQLDSLVLWIMEDGQRRDQEELAAELRQELGIIRRSHRVDTAMNNAIRRALG
ncbi:hypothetical protein V5R04_01000 [Jonesiaceae bacterium BS-20]|uniref:Restriction endonuclease type II-like domain-containing protein n=1 Tax=Jonesiaceae bacterium BS-20 TaxID=3120821 RepID=A0AAU7DVU4_9MICO